MTFPENTYFRESGCFLLNRRRNQPFIINMQHGSQPLVPQRP